MYEPSAIPLDSPPRLRAWLRRQLNEIASALARPTVQSVRLASLAAEPDRYQDGDIVYADGANWDPGSGAGVYARESGAWVKL